MEYTSILRPAEIKSTSYKYIGYLSKENEVYRDIMKKVNNMVADQSLEGKAVEALKQQVSNYFDVLIGLCTANEADINDANALINLVGDEELIGKDIIQGKEQARNDSNNYGSSASSCYQKAYLATDNAAMEYWRRQGNYYDGLKNAADQRYNYYLGKENRFDSINAESSKLFWNSKGIRKNVYRLLDAMSNSFVNYSYDDSKCSVLRTEIGVAINSYPEFGDQISRGGEILADELRNMKDENGNPLYTEEEIQNIIKNFEEKYPGLLRDLATTKDMNIQQYYPVVLQSILKKIKDVEYDVVIPDTVYGNVNGRVIVLHPRETWGICGGGLYGNGINVDSEGRYIVAVGPGILNPDYPDDGHVWRDDFELPVPIDLYLRNKATGEIVVIHCVVEDIKAHTYNSYPEGNVSFDVDNGTVQTGVAYPNSWNYQNETPFAENHIDGSVVEFMGGDVGFDISDYELEGIEIVE